MPFSEEGEGMKKGRRRPKPTGASTPPRLRGCHPLPRQPDPNLTTQLTRHAVKNTRRLKDIFPHVR